jgi:S1-C subfamily serine protease
MREIADVVLSTHELAARAILDLLSILSTPEQRAEAVREYVEGGSCFDKTEVKLNRLNLGYFSDHDLLMMLLSFKVRNGGDYRVNATIIGHVVERLAKYGLVIRNEMPGLNELKVAENSIPFFNATGLAHNIVFGVSHMIERVAHAVPAINVRNENGDIECGSGIVLRTSNVQEPAFLITNKHVLDGNEIVNIISNGNEIEILEGPIFHDAADLAAIRISPTPKMPLVPIDDAAPVLTPIVALGYPRVPFAAGQFLLAHRGEVNGSMTSLSGDQFLLISCHVSPGNSGGPIVTEAGFCAGIVTQSGIGEFGNVDDPTGVHRTTYHMAIPPAVLSDFVAKLNQGLC